MTEALRDNRIELRLAVEEFLYHEAALLDEWRLDDWLELFTPDAQYVVPSTDVPDGDGSQTLVLLQDNFQRIGGRVARLKSRRAHREFPSSRTRRMISNVRVLRSEGDEVEVTANFVVYRIRRGVSEYIGRYLYTLVCTDDGFRIRSRRAELDLEALDPHGTVSIIL